MTTVLVVDDEPDVRLVARVVLTAAGYTVVEADCGEAALDALDALDQETPPDVMLLDVRMPGIDGWEVLRRVRANPTHGHLPIVVLTAHLAARDDAPEGLRDYEFFMTKPFKPDELLAAVKEAMAA